LERASLSSAPQDASGEIERRQKLSGAIHFTMSIRLAGMDLKEKQACMKLHSEDSDASLSESDIRGDMSESNTLFTLS
jgi:hypothetical protein